MRNQNYKIFKTGSTTFFTASLFFPKQVKRDVFTLYAFVRKFDDFVDSRPQQPEQYFEWKNQYLQSLSGQKSGNEVVDNFVDLQQAKQFDQSWVDSFFESMEMDITNGEYQTLKHTLHYIYGSAEVIGLMMAQILNLPKDSWPSAQLLGRAFQYMNMIRDIAEDQSFGRTYLPREEYAKLGMQNLSLNHVQDHREEFAKFIRTEVNRYRQWREEASKGFHFIPKRLLIPIAAAAEMFDYTIDVIDRDPMVVFEKKVKPPKFRIFLSVLKQLFV